MNRIEFKIIDNPEKNSGGEPITKIFIDGKDFIDMISEYESKIPEAHDGDLAGAYQGQYAKSLYRALLPDWAKFEAVCVCTCGEEDCWPMVMDYYKTNKEVVWENFHQPWRMGDDIHHPKWDYSTFGPFTFDRKQYEDELSKFRESLIKIFGEKDLEEYVKSYQSEKSGYYD